MFKHSYAGIYYGYCDPLIVALDPGGASAYLTLSGTTLTLAPT